MYSIESIFVVGPSNILFGGVYVCTFSRQAVAVKGLRQWYHQKTVSYLVRIML